MIPASAYYIATQNVVHRVFYVISTSNENKYACMSVDQNLYRPDNGRARVHYIVAEEQHFERQCKPCVERSNDYYD